MSQKLEQSLSMDFAANQKSLVIMKRECRRLEDARHYIVEMLKSDTLAEVVKAELRRKNEVLRGLVSEKNSEIVRLQNELSLKGEGAKVYRILDSLGIDFDKL